MDRHTNAEGASHGTPPPEEEPQATNGCWGRVIPLLGCPIQSGQHRNHIHTNNKHKLCRLQILCLCIHIRAHVYDINKEKEAINLRTGGICRELEEETWEGLEGGKGWRRVRWLCFNLKCINMHVSGASIAIWKQMWADMNSALYSSASSFGLDGTVQLSPSCLNTRKQ